MKKNEKNTNANNREIRSCTLKALKLDPRLWTVEPSPFTLKTQPSDDSSPASQCSPFNLQTTQPWTLDP
eukprot:2456232-Rhodomonas_salina.1